MNKRQTYEQFFSNAEAEREGESWTVYVNGKGKLGKIYGCAGETPYEAIEDAWRYYCALCDELERMDRQPRV